MSAPAAIALIWLLSSYLTPRIAVDLAERRKHNDHPREQLVLHLGYPRSRWQLVIPLPVYRKGK